MSTSSNDPNATDLSPERPPTEQAPTKPTSVGRGSQVLATALAAAGATQARVAAAVAPPDRAYLEALLHGSWTQPPDLNAARQLPGEASDDLETPGEFAGIFAAPFNDTDNPHPTPYTDSRYVDSGFGDRTE
jgi:hypothetical protein